MLPISPSHLATADGRYDRLYRACGILWPSQPGRMVKRAAANVQPGRALDAGCGDGKNAAYLSRLGWAVEAFDISEDALTSFERRMNSEALQIQGKVWQDDVTTATLESRSYDLVVAYGLYHCLADDELINAHERLLQAVKANGLFVFAAFNSDLPIPKGHGTGHMVLRTRDHIVGLMNGWEVLALESGVIHEHHKPIIGDHSHALTWGIFRRIAT